MALHKDEAIVLFKRAYGESDKIIRLFTLKSGKIGAIAKGANKSQKRFMNTLEPFNHINVEYFERHGKGMVRIENADIIETNSGIETSLKKACTAGFFTEFVDKLTKEKERHDELFYTLKEVLKNIKHVEFTFNDILYYQLKMLETLGYMPNFHACVYCGKDILEDKKLYFSKERGGILCPICSRSLPHNTYPVGVIPRLASMRNAKDSSEFGVRSSEKFIGKTNTEKDEGFEKEAREIMEDFMSFHLDVEFKSYRILKETALRVDSKQ
ncbi:MAG: DNA repair protein RecO [Proteobacteria bacterium]|jgi:DNA repair protein RecO (recombination protein O)|nr:DNA repair protein RecO [Pseudomonadota bacterium]